MSKTIEKLQTSARELEAQQRETKAELRQNHLEIGIYQASCLMMRKFNLRHELRAHYLVIAFLQGKPYKTVEDKAVEQPHYYVRYNVKKLFEKYDFEDEAFKTFTSWLTH